MPQANPPSPWRIPLVREIGIILLIKLATLLTILGGLIPARSAAKSNPVIALRSE